MAEVVILVSGGIVRAVYCDGQGVSVEVVDFDEVEALEAEREKDPKAFVDYLWGLRHVLTGLAQPVVETDPDALAIDTARYPYALY